MAICTLSSCGKRNDEPPEGGRAPGAANDESPISTVKISELNSHESGAVTHGGELYTGRAIEINADGERLKERYYIGGYLDGPVREFYEDGSKKSDITHKKGVADGLGFEWDRDGNMTQLFYKEGVETHRVDPKSAESQSPSPD